MLAFTNIYKFSIHWNQNQKEIKLHMLETHKLTKSWNDLYSKGGISLRKMMDSAYSKAQPDEN